MKPAAFAYHRPHSVVEALELLDHYQDDAKVLAGGQSLVPVMNFRLAAPEHLVDVNGLTELGGCETTSSALRLGALTRHSELDTRNLIRVGCPLLAQAAPYIGHPQIRSRGTLGGSLAHADSSAELPGVMVALDATIVALSLRGERRIPVKEFFSSHFTTTLETDEILVAVEVPVAAEREGSSFLEVAARRGDFALAGVAVVVTVGDDDTISDARIAGISVAATPVRFFAAEKFLRGQKPTAEVLATVAATVQDGLHPTSDLKASAAYKSRTAGVLAGRAVKRAWDNARGRTT